MKTLTTILLLIAAVTLANDSKVDDSPGVLPPALAESENSSTQTPTATEGVSVLGDWQASNPHWNGLLTIRVDGTFSRPHGDGGRWVLGGDPDHPILILRWNAWGTETLSMITPVHFRGSRANAGMELRRAPTKNSVEQHPDPDSDNLLQAMGKPSDEQDDYIKREADKLAKSKVSTADAAIALANDSFIKKRGLDARENVRVSGLYRIGLTMTNFASEGDLIWEVRVSRLGSGVSGIVWVSTTTKKAKVLFPAKQWK